MAFAVPVVAAVGAGIAAVAGVGVGGTALGFALSFREKMKHTTTAISHVMNLTEGDHISLRKRCNLPFRHAVVVEPVRDPKDKIKVVYHSGLKASARVEFMEVDLCDQARKGELVRHQYEALICYPAQAVVARATSLCSKYNPTERRDVLRMYWPFFVDDEHFANWCQIGFRFTDGVKASMVSVVTDYTRTLVSDVSRVSEGDHIMMEDGLSGVVVRVGEKMAQVEVSRFPSEDHRGPALIVINDITRLYRLDYDIAVGVSGHTAKDVALNETTQPTEPMPYSSSDEFAVWCKTLLRPTVEWRVAAALAAARMTGRLWAWVHAVDELRPGDHVAFNCGTIYYYQHAIVTSIEGHQVNMIYLLGNVPDVTRMVVQSNTVNVSKYLRAEKLCKYFYDVREWYDPDTVIARATGLVGSTADKLPFKDPQHFAMWCKTGTYQLHC